MVAKAKAKGRRQQAIHLTWKSVTVPCSFHTNANTLTHRLTHAHTHSHSESVVASSHFGPPRWPKEKDTWAPKHAITANVQTHTQSTCKESVEREKNRERGRESGTERACTASWLRLFCAPVQLLCPSAPILPGAFRLLTRLMDCAWPEGPAGLGGLRRQALLLLWPHCGQLPCSLCSCSCSYTSVCVCVWHQVGGPHSIILWFCIPFCVLFGFCIFNAAAGAAAAAPHCTLHSFFKFPKILPKFFFPSFPLLSLPVFG